MCCISCIWQSFGDIAKVDLEEHIPSAFFTFATRQSAEMVCWSSRLLAYLPVCLPAWLPTYLSALLSACLYHHTFKPLHVIGLFTQLKSALYIKYLKCHLHSPITFHLQAIAQGSKFKQKTLVVRWNQVTPKIRADSVTDSVDDDVSLSACLPSLPACQPACHLHMSNNIHTNLQQMY